MRRPFLLHAALAATLLSATGHAGEAGAPGERGLAVRCAKALVCSPDPDDAQYVDNALVLVRDGKIERVEPARGAQVPEGYELLDVGERWVMPGFVELHCHEGGSYDINDVVYLANPGVRASTSIVPRNERLERGLASGVTTVLVIPGSGSNIGGHGILLKTGFRHFEDARLRDPGSLKIAQWGNPESWTIGVGMAFEHWNTRHTLRRGVAYARQWERHEAGTGPEPERSIQFDIFRDLVAGRAQISTHTQMYQVVLMTLTMIKGELGLPVFLDHSTIGGWLAGAKAHEMGVPAIVGPRSLDTTARGMMNWTRNKHEGMRGVAAGYQSEGHDMVGFNTDSPVIPQETLQLQAAMGVRYGFEDTSLEAVRGLTVVPAMTVDLADRIGSLSPGTDADLVIISGHPADPRSWVQAVWTEGHKVYESEEGRLW